MKPNQSAKRVDIVRIKLVKEGSVRYKGRTIHRPDDGYTLMKEFLDGLDREHFLVVSLDMKNQPVSVNVCHIGSLNASLVYPRNLIERGRRDGRTQASEWEHGTVTRRSRGNQTSERGV